MRFLFTALLLVACKGDKDSTDTAAPTAAGCADGSGCLVAQDLAAGLLSVRAIADDDVWVVGASPDPADGTGPALLHYDGSAWERLDTSAWAGAELWWVWVDSSEAVYVGDQGLILEMSRSDNQLTRAEGPDDGVQFFGVWGASGDDLWAVGHTDGGSGPAALWRRLNGTWAEYSQKDLKLDDGVAFFKVHGTSANDAWIVGALGTALHWDGSTWTRVATNTIAYTDTAPLLTIDVGGERPIAVGGAGNGLILEYDGSDWLDVSPEFQPGFNGVCTGAGAAWAVGQYGARAERGSDGVWTSDTDKGLSPTIYDDWHGCAISPSGAVWTVGGRIASRPLTAGAIGYTGPGEPPAVEL